MSDLEKLEELIRQLKLEKAVGCNPVICDALLYLLRQQMPD